MLQLKRLKLEAGRLHRHITSMGINPLKMGRVENCTGINKDNKKFFGPIPLLG
jgi:hypothetical protein